jgi:hypothetical protein
MLPPLLGQALLAGGVGFEAEDRGGHGGLLLVECCASF